MGVLTQFFGKMYFYMYHEAAKKSWQYFRGFYPLKKLFFPTPGSSLSFTKIADYAEMTDLLYRSNAAIRKLLRKLRIMREPHIIYTPPIGGSHRQLNILLSWATN